MTRRWAIPAIVLAALAGAHLANALLAPPSDGDLGWQHWLGAQILRGGLPHALGAESFAASGAPWVPQEWLFCTLLAAASAHGVGWLFALGVGACAVVALACVAMRCARAGAHPVAVAFTMLFVDVAMSQSFGVRVQVVGWAFLAAFLLALELPGHARWTAVAIAVAWANVHASAMLAPVLAGAAAAGSLLGGDRRGAVRDAALALACALALCATPLGVKLPLYALELAHSPIRAWIREWRQTSFSDTAFALGALPLAALAALHARRGPRRGTLLLLPFVYLAVTALRNVPLAAIACAPFAATALSGLLPSLAAFRPFRRTAPASTVLAIAFCATALVSAACARAAVDARPLGAIADLAARPGAHRLFCEDFAWCGPAIDSGRVSVFVDGRADPFPPAVWTEYDDVIKLRANWRAIVRRHAVDAVLVHRDDALDRALRADGWRIVRNGPVRLLLRADAPRAPAPRKRYFGSSASSA